MPVFCRNIKIEMDFVDEASFEILGTLDDNVHSLKARLVIGYPSFEILDASGEITRMPYVGFCTGAMGVMSQLVGHRIGRGFKKKASEVLGGAASCNHLHTLINDMAGSAFQMNYLAAKQRAPRKDWLIDQDQGTRRQIVLKMMPQLRNSCYIFSEANDGLFEQPRVVDAVADVESLES